MHRVQIVCTKSIKLGRKILNNLYFLESFGKTTLLQYHPWYKSSEARFVKRHHDKLMIKQLIELLGYFIKKQNLYQTFLQYPEGHDSSRATTAFLARKWRERWSEAVQNIDFSHFSRVAWSRLNDLTGGSRQSPHQCPVLANAIARQLVKNEKYEDVHANRETFRLVMQQLSDLWRATL